MTKTDDADFKTAIALAEEPNDTFPELARRLAKVHERDRSGLGRFVQQSDIKRRKAYYLLELGKKLPSLRIPDERLRKIGWTKLQIILEKLDGRSADKWLKLAEAHSTEELKALMLGHKPSSKAHCVQLYFTQRQYHQLEKAILSFGGKRSGRGLIDKEAAIMRMVRNACSPGSENHRC